MNEAVHGEPSWCLSNGLVKVWVTHRAGHLAPVEFRLGSRKVSPYALAPWQRHEIEPALPELLQVLRGDFFCFPFGGQADGAPPHGVSANDDWKIVAGSEDMLHIGMDDPDAGGWIEKLVSVREGETAVYQEHRISGVEGRYSYGNHPILDLSNLRDGMGRVTVSPFRKGMVYPGFFSNPEAREYGALKPHGTFSDLREVPLATGGSADLTHYPARLGFDDLVMMVNEPATEEQPFAWSAVVFDGYVWYALKDPTDFPATMFWMSNGGRHAEPWGGRHLGRLGVEEVCSHFSDGVDVSREDRLKDDGVPTTRTFRPDETVSLRTIQAVALVPDDFGAVKSIQPAGPGQVVITGESGAQVTAATDWSFVLC
ncbi:MAG: hypothetical protein JWO82_429 [Akkermansiaceae bacterium]|nr:hypothetical protein [Akkermansiaceae bacterium]